jgi:hypothetical protein
MIIQFDLSALKRTRWYEYGIRFLLGGGITVVAGFLANRYGPLLGGLFLAFPAIFPASATLVEKHETQKKRRAGLSGSSRGRLAAALDGRGAILGSVGLVCFALAVWLLLPLLNAALTFAIALAVWMGVSIAIWSFEKHHRGHIFSPR